MSDEAPIDQSAVDAAFERFKQTPDEHCYFAHQTSFHEVIAMCWHSAECWLVDRVPNSAQMPLSQVHDILNHACTFALVTGAKIFASLSRAENEPPLTNAVNFSSVWAAIDSIMSNETESELTNAFRASLNQSGPVETLIAIVCHGILHDIKEKHSSAVQDDKEWGQFVFSHLLCGAVTEFCYVRLAAEQREGLGVFGRIVETITGNPDLNDPANQATFEARIQLPDAILAWPEDEQCACGRSLKPAIYCCDPNLPIDMREYREQLSPDFDLKRPCCGQIFKGFRCDACGRVYSWQKGVVPTVTAFKYS